MKRSTRGDPCTGCGRVGYYKLGRCLDCLKGKCGECGKVKILRHRTSCAECYRRLAKKRRTQG